MSTDTSKPPLVSILVCTYNRAEYLDDCLYSVLRQDFQDYEIIIRDNNSTDTTQDVVAKYRVLFDLGENYRYIQNPTNIGFIQNMRDGITKDCRGKYCVNLADDDFFITRQALSLFAAALESCRDIAFVRSSVLVYVQGKEVNNPKSLMREGVKYTAETSYKLLDGNEYFLNYWSKYPGLNFSATMFRRELAVTRNWKTFGSLDQSMAMLLSLNKIIASYEIPLTCYRKHNDPARGEVSLSTSGLPVEQAFDAYKSIRNWGSFALENMRVSRLSLFAWRLKVMIMVPNGAIRWMYQRSDGRLQQYLDLIKKNSFMDYWVIRYLNQEFIRIDKSEWNYSGFRGLFHNWAIFARNKTSRLVELGERMWHDPDFSLKTLTRLSVKHLKNKN